ncbi:probable cytochrome P450 6a13 [Neodiprion lecontei]|uniref:Probable cytochrome P450 6a13 n=1 Tax=Neodiprion lecontei TaxID=441921 RepID=A0ABM3G790_NEOLC|nr:probable cytochrome P450 6a13 [Neodiprion lecontei]
MFTQIVVNTCLVLVGVLTVLYLYIRRQFTYWERLGVPYVKPDSFLGNFGDSFTKKRPMSEMLIEVYDKSSGKGFTGVWNFFSPALFLANPEVLCDIMIKNFDAWTDRGVPKNPESDPLSQHVAALDGKMWKDVRTKLTPTFTSAKLKHMHHLLLECGKDLEKYLESLVSKNEAIEAREVSAKFATDVIGSCAFGIQMNSLSDEDAAFRNMGKKMLDVTMGQRFAIVVVLCSPWLFKKLKLSLTRPDVEEFFLRYTRETFEYREKNNVQKHDFIDLLRNLKNVDQSLGEGETVFDDKLLTAQAFVFFGAGFETSSTTIGYALHELAVNQDMQDRLRKELHEMKAANKGEITWDGLQGMKYLDMIFQETLRKYPVVPQVSRVSVKPYQLPGTNVVLPSGSRCIIPIYAFHHDPQFFPNPEIFDPKRFTDEAKAHRRPLTFIPFGGGPRNCIASRFAEQQTKIGIVSAIDKFKLSLCEKSQNPIQYKKGELFLHSDIGVWIKVSRIGADNK